MTRATHPLLPSPTPGDPRRPAVLAADGVVVALGGIPVVRGVDLRLTAGEAVGLTGANGSGKTTLVRALLGLVGHQRGTITVFDTPLARFRDWRRVGYVPQRQSVTGAVATAREVVTSGLLAERRPFLPLSRAQRARVDEALDRVGMRHRAGSPVAEMSGGQQQRVLLARALVGRVDLLVLDEPLAGVDVASQEALADLLVELRDAGTAILAVVHELGPFARLLQRTVHLADGLVADEHVGEACAVDLEVGEDHHHHDDRRRPAPVLDHPLTETPRGGGA